jgi:hypothetical protein
MSLKDLTMRAVAALKSIPADASAKLSDAKTTKVEVKQPTPKSDDT